MAVKITILYPSSCRHRIMVVGVRDRKDVIIVVIVRPAVRRGGATPREPSTEMCPLLRMSRRLRLLAVEALGLLKAESKRLRILSVELHCVRLRRGQLPIEDGVEEMLLRISGRCWLKSSIERT